MEAVELLLHVFNARMWIHPDAKWDKKGAGTGRLREFTVSITPSSAVPDLTRVRVQLLVVDGERFNSTDIFFVWSTRFLLNEGTGGSWKENKLLLDKHGAINIPLVFLWSSLFSFVKPNYHLRQVLKFVSSVKMGIYFSCSLLCF